MTCTYQLVESAEKSELRKDHYLLHAGYAIDPQCHVIDTGYKFPGLPTGEPQTMVRGHLRLPLSLAALETVERLRQGEPFEFTVVMRGSVFVHDKQTKLYETCRFQVGISSGTPIQFRADRDNWIQQWQRVSDGEHPGGNPAGDK